MHEQPGEEGTTVKHLTEKIKSKEAQKSCSRLRALFRQLHNIVECRSGIKLAFNRTKAFRVTKTYAQATNRIYSITQTAHIYSRPPTLLS